MTNAKYLQIHRLPSQIEAVRARLAQLERTPRHERKAYWLRRHSTVTAKHKRLIARAAELGLRDLAQAGEVA
ncbi:hypothetical protein FIM10_01950 [Sphingomonadales bacterium 56]|uniref:hypothetical protein n=1 Tax=unclassified Sphingobium TaxID=2611147 RepID=UPI0019192B54|nr:MULTISPECIES: hypothetical protein [unclassified Sphingobium]MBY2927446.1 hypothetical protein [Sphingomonadales bacterium 56]MBY2957514.1 hypothetical protein [Sphingomonadales bacterium 58]MBY2957557.1 hypothetical protein [Sphingomonadales bacterium 58]CAD7335217.1 hypothetical protein SPHS8_00396 [Sphingobium sp. S8]CAD7335236.1 hypothetical protein SPHS6_00396 [Sphingobium sp. S6]